MIKIFLQALVFESIFQSLFASSAQAITCADLFRHSSTSQIDTLAPIPQDGPQFHAYALTKASEARTSRFKEFEIIREVAARHGLRIWLWGESAGAYSGYTLKILGTHKDRIQKTTTNVLEIFDYSIGLQLVVDGSNHAAYSLEQELKGLFSKSFSVNAGLLTVHALDRTQPSSKDTGPKFDAQKWNGLPASLKAAMTSSPTVEATFIEAVEISAGEFSRVRQVNSVEAKFLKELKAGRVNVFELAAGLSHDDLSLSLRMVSREPVSPQSSLEVKVRDAFKSVVSLRDSVHGEERIRYIETVGPMSDVLRSLKLIDGLSHSRYLLRTLIHAGRSPDVRKVAAVEFLLVSSGAPLMALLKLKDYISAAEYSEILIEMKLWGQNENWRKRQFAETLEIIKDRAGRATLQDFERAGISVLQAD